MRLLQINDAGDLSLTDPLDVVPPYAILSHTWGKDCDELKLQDVVKGDYKTNEGYGKVSFCGLQAKKDGLDHFWVDTCCIDKTSSAELSEAINSMFRWYQDAAKCYVYLTDVSTTKMDHAGGSEANWTEAFRSSRWFTRGWTLQELLAPATVEFFSREKKFIGSKCEMHALIEDITRIPRQALQGASLSEFTVEQKLKWASKRKTKKVEDESYCLLGIFDVHMPSSYGERSEAKRRLMGEIAEKYRARLYTAGFNHPPPDPAGGHLEWNSRRAALLASLDFEQMGSGRSTIKDAETATCNWFLEHQTYVAWNDFAAQHENHGFLWLMGNPGAGKSTLVKFAHAHAIRTRRPNGIVLAFYFNAGGHELEKSTTGMYRSLLSQLFKQNATSQDVLNSFDKEFFEGNRAPIWTITALQALMQLTFSGLGDRRLTCFIDALDECDEAEVRDMIKFFQTASFDSGLWLHICFASRHYPVINVKHGTVLILENESGHREDLVKYTQSQLQLRNGACRDRVETSILEKANGVFMWAVLVIEILNDEYRRGRMFNVEKRLEGLPPKLGGLFKAILRRDTIDMDCLLLSLQWVLFAERPLEMKEFYFAMISRISPGSAAEWDPVDVTTEDMARFVRDSSKGLVEPTKLETPTVQFIHESVRDFLVKDGGLIELWPELAADVKRLSHDRMKECCQQYWMTAHANNLSANYSELTLPKASSDESMTMREEVSYKLPFLDYAINNVWYHANEAAVAVAQQDFLNSFPLRRWIWTKKIVTAHDAYRLSLDASLTYILAENGRTHLIQCALKQGFPGNVEGERYRYPVLAALANARTDTASVLLQHYDAQLRQSDLCKLHLSQQSGLRRDESLFFWAVNHGTDDLAAALLNYLPVDFSRISRLQGKSCHIFARKNFVRTVSRLIVLNKSHVELRDHTGDTLLLAATQHGNKDLVDLLLDSGADIDKHPDDLNTPLMKACESNNNGMVQHLLKRGADVNTVDLDGRGALVKAAVSGNVATVQLILDQGARTETKNTRERTALMEAASLGHIDVVQLLLDRGADVEAKDHLDNTILMKAAMHGHIAVVNLLLYCGADVEAVNYNHWTALTHAVSKGNSEMVGVLLNRSASRRYSSCK